MSHLGGDDLTHFFLVLLEDVFLLVLRNFGLEVLAQCKDVAATKALNA